MNPAVCYTLSMVGPQRATKGLVGKFEAFVLGSFTLCTEIRHNLPCYTQTWAPYYDLRTPLGDGNIFRKCG